MANRQGRLYAGDYHRPVGSLGDQETIITINSTEGMVHIRSSESLWQRHLETVLGVMPLAKCGHCREYRLPKSWLRLPQKPLKTRQRG